MAVKRRPRRRTTTDHTARKVAYLWGAGATQAEVSFLGNDPVNLGMRDSERLGTGISSRIIQRLPAKWHRALQSDLGIDIEKVISLLAGSGLAIHHDHATQMRELYFNDVCRQLVRTGVPKRPQLALSL